METNERVIIETSVLAVTLLFVIVQTGKEWIDPAIYGRQVAFVSGIACLFMVAAVIATLSVIGEHGPTLREVLSIAQNTPFVAGLFMLAAMFYDMAKQFPEYANVVYVILIYVVIAAGLVLVQRFFRRRKGQIGRSVQREEAG